MTTGTRVLRRRLRCRQDQSAPYPLPRWGILDKELHHPKKKCSKVAVEKKDWEDATCSVCLEYPHNAVLLLCSSHDKGCRPYICATSYRYSNCLDQFEKAYVKIMSDEGNLRSAGTEKCEVMEIAACPLCRGEVKGWTIVEPARKYLNAKKRSCMQDTCSFVGSYKELRKHVKREHPCARPREVDPVVEQKWIRLENERARDDVISTIRSSMPGAMVLGDYVIERGNHRHFDTMDEDDNDGGGADEDYGDHEMDNNILNVFFLLHAIGSTGSSSLNTRLRRFGRGSFHGGSLLDGEVVAAAASASEGEEEDEEDVSTAVDHWRGSPGRRWRYGRGAFGGGSVLVRPGEGVRHGDIPPVTAAASDGEVVAAAASASEGEDEEEDVSTVVDRWRGTGERRWRHRSQRRSTADIS